MRGTRIKLNDSIITSITNFSNKTNVEYGKKVSNVTNVKLINCDSLLNPYEFNDFFN